jgi:hypothetical protein
MAASGQEERFPPTKLSAGCGFRKETIAGMRRNGRDAPIAAARQTTISRLKSTHLGHSGSALGMALPAPTADLYAASGGNRKRPFVGPGKALSEAAALPIRARRRTQLIHRTPAAGSRPFSGFGGALSPIFLAMPYLPAWAEMAH